MHFSVYQQQTKLTAIYPKTKALEYLSFGLISEIEELKSAIKLCSDGFPTQNLKKEVGDCFWYVSELCTWLGIQGSELFQCDPVRLMQPTKDLASTVKKYIRGDFEVTHLQARLSDVLATTVYYLNEVVSRYKMDLGEILQANIDKLLTRKEAGTLQGDGDDR